MVKKKNHNKAKVISPKNTSGKKKGNSRLEGNIVKASASGHGMNYFTPKFNYPQYNEQSIMTPHDRVGLMEILRWFYTYHPLVHNIVDLHSTYPISKFTLSGISDDFVMQYFENMSNELDLMRTMIYMNREYHLAGEVFPYGVWEESKGRFTDIIILDPDDVEVLASPFGGSRGTSIIELKPDPQMVELAKKDNEARMFLQDNLDDRIFNSIIRNKNLTIPSFNIEQIASFNSPKATRGTGIVHCILHELLYEQKLVSASWAAADRVINPLTIYSIEPYKKEMSLVQEDIDQFTDLLEAARRGNISEIVYWNGVKVTQSKTGLPQTSSDLKRVDDRIMVGLMVNQAMITSNGPTWNSVNTAKKILMSRYIMLRDLFEDYLEQKIFIPTAKAQLFYGVSRKEANFNYRMSPNWGRKTIDIKKLGSGGYVMVDKSKVGDEIVYNGLKYRLFDKELHEDGTGKVVLADSSAKTLMVPTINWRGKIDLTEDNNLMNFITKGFERGTMPFKMVTDLFGLDYNYIEEWLIREKGTFFDPAFIETGKKVYQDKDKGPKIYYKILFDSLTKFYEKYPDDMPEEFVEIKEKFFKESKLSLAEKRYIKELYRCTADGEKALGVKEFGNKVSDYEYRGDPFGYKSVKRTALQDSLENPDIFLGLGYNEEFLRLWGYCNKDIIDDKEFKKKVGKLMGVRGKVFDKLSAIDLYWKSKFEYFNSHGIGKVYKMSFDVIDDLGKGFDTRVYVKGSVASIREGFTQYMEQDMNVGDVKVMGMPIYLRYFISGMEFNEKLSVIQFGDEDRFEEKDGILYCDKSVDAKDILEKLREFTE